jgi:hypothetical protein
MTCEETQEKVPSVIAPLADTPTTSHYLLAHVRVHSFIWGFFCDSMATRDVVGKKRETTMSEHFNSALTVYCVCIVEWR